MLGRSSDTPGIPKNTSGPVYIPLNIVPREPGDIPCSRRELEPGKRPAEAWGVAWMLGFPGTHFRQPQPYNRRHREDTFIHIRAVVSRPTETCRICWIADYDALFVAASHQTGFADYDGLVFQAISIYGTPEYSILASGWSHSSIPDWLLVLVWICYKINIHHFVLGSRQLYSVMNCFLVCQLYTHWNPTPTVSTLLLLQYQG